MNVLYLPAAHAEHELATTGVEYPALHKKLFVSGAMALVGRLVHISLPLATLYLPAAHTEHAFATTGVE